MSTQIIDLIQYLPNTEAKIQRFHEINNILKTHPLAASKYGDDTWWPIKDLDDFFKRVFRTEHYQPELIKIRYDIHNKAISVHHPKFRYSFCIKLADSSFAINSIYYYEGRLTKEEMKSYIKNIEFK